MSRQKTGIYRPAYESLQNNYQFTNAHHAVNIPAISEFNLFIMYGNLLEFK